MAIDLIIDYIEPSKMYMFKPRLRRRLPCYPAQNVNLSFLSKHLYGCMRLDFALKTTSGKIQRYYGGQVTIRYRGPIAYRGLTK